MKQSQKASSKDQCHWYHLQQWKFHFVPKGLVELASEMDRSNRWSCRGQGHRRHGVWGRRRHGFRRSRRRRWRGRWSHCGIGLGQRIEPVFPKLGRPKNGFGEIGERDLKRLGKKKKKRVIWRRRSRLSLRTWRTRKWAWQEKSGIWVCECMVISPSWTFLGLMGCYQCGTFASIVTFSWENLGDFDQNPRFLFSFFSGFSCNVEENLGLGHRKSFYFFLKSSPCWCWR